MNNHGHFVHSKSRLIPDIGAVAIDLISFIMTIIAEFTKAKFVTVLDEITGELNGIASKIKQLNNSDGKVTPADQKLVDDISAQSHDLIERLEELRKDATDGSLNVPPAPIPGPDGKLPPGSLDPVIHRPTPPVPAPEPAAKTVITPAPMYAAASKK